MSTGLEINCDVGEGTASDADLALLPYVDAVNIACTFHAGSEDILRTTALNARKFGLKIGAHPSFKDRITFGRKNMELSPPEIKRLIWDQLELFQKVAGDFTHVKPHGALYNMSATRVNYAAAIAEAVFDFDPTLSLYGLAGSLSLQEAERIGLRPVAEAFADRTYTAAGILSDRSLPGSLLRTEEAIVAQYRALANGLPIVTIDKKPGPIVRASTLCVHSDSPHALQILQWLNALTHR